MARTWVVTGGAGFIGSNFVRRVLQQYADVNIVVVDALTYAGHRFSLPQTPRLVFEQGEVQDIMMMTRIVREYSPQVIIHMAAETHVDRSIYEPNRFIETNVVGTSTVLESMRGFDDMRLVIVSTDEVYGSLGQDGVFTELSPINPSSPYSASKASADLLALAYHRTYGTDVVITRCSNNYGPYQMPEKFIPVVISKAMQNDLIPIYGDGLQVRDWIHVNDHVDGIVCAVTKGRSGQVYNLGARQEIDNLTMATMILNYLGAPASLLTHVEDRPGHDRRYALSIEKSQQELGFEPLVSFEEGIEETIHWYQSNAHWCERVQSEEHLRHMSTNYSERRVITQ